MCEFELMCGRLQHMRMPSRGRRAQRERQVRECQTRLNKKVMQVRERANSTIITAIEKTASAASMEHPESG